MTHHRTKAAHLPEAGAEHDASADLPLRSPLQGSPGFLVRLAQLRSFDEFSRRLGDLGITPARYSVLAVVAANPGVRPGAVAEELRIAPSNVANLVNQLVVDELVKRSPDSTELRANLLHLTEAGATAFATMERRVAQVDAALLEHLAPDEQAHFVRLLRKLLQR